MNIQDQIAVMQAFADGKEIEYHGAGLWHLAETPQWDWVKFSYRIKEVSRCFTFMGKDYKLREGEKFIGGVIHQDGSATLSILLPGDVHATWEEAKTWAKSIGGDLPTRSEGALLFATMKDEFEEEWYWTREAHASAHYAWSQSFDNGNQLYYDINYKLRARAVRRIEVEKC